MQQYPSIDGSAKSPLGVPCIAFYKYDGSNLRWEWSPKQGWYKFGTRRHLFDASDEVFGKAIPIFMNGMADEIVRRVKDHERGIQRITIFTEYFGPNSFAGKHDENDVMQLRLIDAFLFKRGFMDPRVFVKTFGDMPEAAEVVYQGTLNKQFIADVRAGKYPVYEGVIAKGEFGMVKIKTDAYFKRLNEVYGTEYRQYWE
jgi:hypothetical protein